MKFSFYLNTLVLCCFYSNAKAQPNSPAEEKGYLKIIFNNIINNEPVVLYDSTYVNPFGETYRLTKLKYYISNTVLYSKGKAIRLSNDYHLIDQSSDSSLYFTVAFPENEYDSIQFLLGVDSAMNTSGAQTGALDPMNDMFWTWNSGYVMQKLEGNSPQSKIVNNKIEYHIGGFSGTNSVLNYLVLSFSKDRPLIIQKGKVSTLAIDVDVNGFWNAVSDIQITDTPVCSQPGILAKQIAANFSRLFNIVDIINTK
jgi:hypothetical protein